MQYIHLRQSVGSVLMTYTALDTLSLILDTSYYEFTDWDRYCAAQLPFVLRLTMLPTDRGDRSYSNERTVKTNEELQTSSS